jgi:hypothetical protein
MCLDSTMSAWGSLFLTDSVVFLVQVEHVIREEKFMQAYDLIEVYCELIVARLSIIDSQK